MKIDVEPTAEVIDRMANQLRDYAIDLDRTARSMRDSGDISYAGEAMNNIQNIGMNLRADLLVTRPIREYEKILNNNT
jgi:hypothetical protein